MISGRSSRCLQGISVTTPYTKFCIATVCFTHKSFDAGLCTVMLHFTNCGHRMLVVRIRIPTDSDVSSGRCMTAIDTV